MEMGPRRAQVREGNTPALTDVTRRRHIEPRCFVRDFEGIAPIIRNDATGSDGRCETLPIKFGECKYMIPIASQLSAVVKLGS